VGKEVAVGGGIVGVLVAVGVRVGCGAAPAQAANKAQISAKNMSLKKVFFIGSSLICKTCQR